MNYHKKLPSGIELISDTVVRKHATFPKDRVEAIEFMQAITLHLIVNPDPMIVPVYRFEYEGLTIHDNYGYAYGTHSYSYDMKRLGLLSSHEEELIDLVEDNHSAGFEEPTKIHDKPARQKLLLHGWDKHKKLMEFLQTIINQDRYFDLHGGNIMKDEHDDFKLIDLEGFMKSPLFGEQNKWITTLRTGAHQPTVASR
jgi:hypothetical protein